MAPTPDATVEPELLTCDPAVLVPPVFQTIHLLKFAVQVCTVCPKEIPCNGSEPICCSIRTKSGMTNVETETTVRYCGRF